MNEQAATIGHNNPPDPIEEVLSQYDGIILEAHNWADGEPVTDEAGMRAVDEVLKQFKAYKSALAKAAKERTDPLHKAWKAEVAAVKVYTDDADLLQKSLVACVAPFKEELAARKREEQRKAWEAAEAAKREAERIVEASNKADIDAQREAQAAKEAAVAADKAAREKAKDGVKGMRTVHHHEIFDMRALVNWIAKNDKDAMAAFAENYAAKKFRETDMDGVRKWIAKEAF